MATVATGAASGTATQWNGAGKVFIAPSGVAAALYFDSSTWQLAKASSPYTSWSSVTAITNSVLAGGLAAEMDRSTGDLHVFYKKTGGPLPCYRKLTYGAGTWSLGSEVVLETGVDYSNDAAPVTACLDRSGRPWAKYAEWVGGYQNHLWYSGTGGASFTDYFEGEPAANNGNAAHVAPCYNGGTDYLLFMFQQDGQIRWRRATTSGAVGVISSLSTQDEGLYADHSSDMAMLSDGRVMNAACPSGTDYTAPQVHIYSPSANTWDGGTTVGTNNTDKWPSLATNPTTGTMYLVWSEGSASSFAIVYREFTPGADTWGTKQTVQAAGSNRIYTDCYCDGVTLLILCTNGTTVESFAVTVGTPAAQDTPELRGRPFGRRGQTHMHQLLAQ